MRTTPTREHIRELEAELSKARETAAKLEDVLPKAEQLLAERQADLDDLIRQNNAVVDRLNAARQDLADAGALRSTGAAGKLQPQDPARAGQALADGSWAMSEYERLTPLLAERRSLVAQQAKHLRKLRQWLTVVVEQNIPSAEAALAKARARFEAGQQPPPPEPEPTWGDRLAALRAKVGA